MAYGLPKLLRFLRSWDDYQGFIGLSTAYFIHLVSIAQCRFGVTGDIAEIGVAAGKSFAALAFSRREGERLLACDLFRTGLEKDNCPEVNLPMFVDILEHLGIPPSDVSILEQDSVRVSDEAFLAATGQPLGAGGYRLFHVDGGHYAEAALSDLNVAACALVPGGIVLMDDLHNMAWPGVQEGLHRYMQAAPGLRRRLEPFLYTGRLFLTTPGPYARAYRRAVLQAHPSLEQELLYGSLVILAGSVKVDAAAFEPMLLQEMRRFGVT